jgi:hypothetical protein
VLEDATLAQVEIDHGRGVRDRCINQLERTRVILCQWRQNQCPHQSQAKLRQKKFEIERIQAYGGLHQSAERHTNRPREYKKDLRSLKPKLNRKRPYQKRWNQSA